MCGTLATHATRHTPATRLRAVPNIAQGGDATLPPMAMYPSDALGRRPPVEFSHPYLTYILVRQNSYSVGRMKPHNNDY